MEAQKDSLPPKWRKARFDECFSRIERKVTLNDLTTYNCVGVRWYGNGAFVREKILGANIARKQQWVLHKGDIVYNKLFAWKGSFALAGPEVDGSIVSDKFPTYRPREGKIHCDYAALWFKHPALAEQAAALSKGAAAISKLTLNPPQFWDLTIPLAEYSEQARIAAVSQNVLDKAADLRQLHDAGRKEAKALLYAAMHKSFGVLEATGELADVLTGRPENGWSARCDNYPGGVPVLSLGAITGFQYRSTEFKLTSEQVEPTARYWLSEGDLLITRSNTMDLVGHVAIYDGTPNPCIYPDLIMRVPVNQKKASKRFVYWWLRSPRIRAYIQASAKGTSPTMRKISQDTVLRIPFPVSLSRFDQDKLASSLDELEERVIALQKLQSDAEKALDRLSPAVITTAFMGLI